MRVSSFFKKNMSITALFMALILGGAVMFLCGYNPFEAYGAIVQGAFAGKKAICQTLVQATPLSLDSRRAFSGDAVWRSVCGAGWIYESTFWVK